MLGIFAQVLDREQFRADAKVLRSMAWLLFKRCAAPRTNPGVKGGG